MLKKPTKPNLIYLICIYKEDLALNNLQQLTCHKTKPNQTYYGEVEYVNYYATGIPSTYDLLPYGLV